MDTNFTIDDAVIQQAEAVLSELGLSLSAAVTVFLKEVIRRQGIPFELLLDPFYSPSNMAVLRKAVIEANEGRLTEHELIED
jgi:DNA-damage-inducible protein J